MLYLMLHPVISASREKREERGSPLIAMEVYLHEILQERCWAQHCRNITALVSDTLFVF